MRYFIFIGWLSSVLSGLAHAMPSEAEIEAWFNDDAEQRAINVNEGQLRMDASFEGILKIRIEFRQP